MTFDPLQRPYRAWAWLMLGLIIALAVYAPGFSGGWLFDDYPNIVDNPGVHPASRDLPSLINAALSSPSSDFKRPLASLSFALNFMVSGLDPQPMKITNVVIHLANGLLVFVLLRAVMRAAHQEKRRQNDEIAVLIAVIWLLLPINLTSVLYVVQRMESLANLFVLLGIIAYVRGRERMLAGQRGLGLCVAGVLLSTLIGAMAKETAILLPLYALACEVFLFRWKQPPREGLAATHDRRIIVFFMLVLAVPLVVGSAWLAPSLLNPTTWARRDFTLGTRLLSEARVVVDYIAWTLLPTPHALSFYHDDFEVSRGLLTPWTTLPSIAVLAMLAWLSWAWRRSRPLAALGIAWYLGCHLLTGTVLPLELIYEHRNYFASMGLLLAMTDIARAAAQKLHISRPAGLLVAVVFVAAQGALTLFTAQAWGDPLSMARELAWRDPQSPRAQYELGRTYVIYSRYDPTSPYVALAQSALENAAGLRGASILPEQALVFMNSRMKRPVNHAWWESMRSKLAARPPTVQDESSLEALSSCLRDSTCHFPPQDLLNCFLAALEHPHPSARLLAMYANFAWSTLDDRVLGLRIQKEAVATSPGEQNYRIGLARMATVMGDFSEAKTQIDRLNAMNIGGRLDRDIAALTTSLNSAKETKAAGIPNTDGPKPAGSGS